MQYVEWANLTDDPDRFFYDAGAKDMFKAHMSAMANRKNSMNGGFSTLAYAKLAAVYCISGFHRVCQGTVGKHHRWTTV